MFWCQLICLSVCYQYLWLSWLCTFLNMSFIASCFHLIVKSNYHLLCFCIIIVSDSLDILHHYVIQSEVNQNHSWLPHSWLPHSWLNYTLMFFHALHHLHVLCLEFWLVQWTVWVPCDWPAWLRWVCFYDAQMKTSAYFVLIEFSLI